MGLSQLLFHSDCKECTLTIRSLLSTSTFYQHRGVCHRHLLCICRPSNHNSPCSCPASRRNRQPSTDSKFGLLCAQTSATALNEGSSRSHTILRLSIESSARAADPAQGSVRTLSALHLIDLAGSESARVRDVFLLGG